MFIKQINAGYRHWQLLNKKFIVLKIGKQISVDYRENQSQQQSFDLSTYEYDSPVIQSPLIENTVLLPNFFYKKKYIEMRDCYAKIL